MYVGALEKIRCLASWIFCLAKVGVFFPSPCGEGALRDVMK
jgi:hypothetical protein